MDENMRICRKNIDLTLQNVTDLIQTNITNKSKFPFCKKKKKINKYDLMASIAIICFQPVLVELK